VTSSRYRSFDEADEYDEYDEYEKPKTQNKLGRAIVVLSSTVAVLLLIGSIYALGFMKRQPTPPPAPAPVSAASKQLAALGRSYLAIADPFDKQLDTEEDAYADSEKGNLAAAKADLRAQVAMEKLFDTQIAAIRFPAAIEATAQALIRANESRFKITERQARSKTLARLRSLDAQREAGNAAVEVQVALIRRQLHLPPESAS
jgi:hypothetical protein